MKIKQIAVSLITASACFTAGAADFANFPPTELPHGYIAPIALSQYNVSNGNAQLFRPWFSNTKHYGDLKAYNLSGLGIVATTSNWSAKDQLETLISGTGWQGRKLFSNSGASATDYGCSTTTDTLKKFICGDRSVEDGTTVRTRTAALGGIVHSQPVYVGAPNDGHTLPGYRAFVSTHKNRAGRVYVGANDGMLHAFDSSTGNEVFGYIPSVVSSKLTDLDAVPFSHQYFVDGQLSVADAYSNFDGTAGDEWATVLVGSLGAGGKGLFALNVTDPTASSMSNAQAKFLWEYTSSNNANLGYSYGKPVIAKLSNGKWGVISGNGYKNSGDGKAHLLILPIKSGDFSAIDIPLGSSTSNGLSAPAVIDSNGDGMVDTVYAGDLDGNLWKVVDTNSTLNAAQQWGIPSILGSNALLTASDGSNSQPILSAPDVAKNPNGSGVIVHVGTGDLIASSGSISSASFHSVYGIVDNGSQTIPITRASLQSHTLTDISGESNYRTLTTGTTVANAKGWVLNLAADEHVLQTPLIRDSRLQLMITDPVNENNWLTQVDYVTGGLPDKVVYDINYDGLLSAELDNIGYVDTNDTGKLVVAVNKNGDLLSRAVVARNAYNDLSYTNRWWNSTPTIVGTGTEEADAVAAETAATTAEEDAADIAVAVPTTVSNPQCTEIFIDKLRSTNDPTNIDFEVTATLDTGAVLKLKASGLPGSYTFDKQRGMGIAGAAVGGGAGTTSGGAAVEWFGLNMKFTNWDDASATDDIDIRIYYNGPYKVTSLTFTISNFNFEEFHDGMQAKNWSRTKTYNDPNDSDATSYSICDTSSTGSGKVGQVSDSSYRSGVTTWLKHNSGVYTAGSGFLGVLNNGLVDFTGPTQAQIDAYQDALDAAAIKRAEADAARALADSLVVERDFDGDGIYDKDDDDDDGDTIMDWDDDDDDNDGIKDWDDKDNKNDKDKDKDGKEDKYEDDDGDGTLNKDEDDDGDGIINEIDTDADGNGIEDATEEVDSGDTGGTSVNVQNGNTEVLGRIRWRELLF